MVSCRFVCYLFDNVNAGGRAMLPAQYAWFEPVLVAAIVVFVIDLVGNTIGFGNRFLSAFMSAIVFALVFGTLVYFGYGSVSMSVTTTPSASAPVQTQK
jgi:signal transduction histidine kinase